MLCKCRSFHLAFVHSVTCQVDVPDPDYFKLWRISVQALCVEQMSALSFKCSGTTLLQRASREPGWSAVTTEPFVGPLLSQSPAAAPAAPSHSWTALDMVLNEPNATSRFPHRHTCFNCFILRPYTCCCYIHICVCEVVEKAIVHTALCVSTFYHHRGAV